MNENSLKAKFKRDAEKEGWHVVSLQDKKIGIPDLLIGKDKRGYMFIECKMLESQSVNTPPSLFSTSRVQYEFMKKAEHVGMALYLVFFVYGGKHYQNSLFRPTDLTSALEHFPNNSVTLKYLQNFYHSYLG